MSAISAALQVPGVRRGAVLAAPVRRLPTGLAPLDALLDGGLPRGYLSELVGARSSGRTTLLHALLASATRRGEVAALIDLPDMVDPPSLARAGVALERVLWVRPPARPSALRCAELILSAGGFGLIALDLGEERNPRRRRNGAGIELDGSRVASVPHSAWLRLAQATRRSTAAVVLCAPQRTTVSSAAVVLDLTRRHVHWAAHLFDGMTTVAELTRSRFSPSERAVAIAFGEPSGAASDAMILHPVRSGGGEAVGRAMMR